LWLTPAKIVEIKEKEMISSKAEKIGKEIWLSVEVHADLDPKHFLPSSFHACNFVSSFQAKSGLVP
jgi:hypothetical protein